MTTSMLLMSYNYYHIIVFFNKSIQTVHLCNPLASPPRCFCKLSNVISFISHLVAPLRCRGWGSTTTSSAPQPPVKPPLRCHPIPEKYDIHRSQSCTCLFLQFFSPFTFLRFSKFEMNWVQFIIFLHPFILLNIYSSLRLRPPAHPFHWCLPQRSPSPTPTAPRPARGSPMAAPGQTVVPCWL